MTSISEKDLDYTAELNSDDDLNSFNDQLHISNNRQTKQLSETQQERLLQYFEDQLLNIQRRFVSRLNPPNGYKDIHELLYDVDKLINVIWYSVVSSEPKNSPKIQSIQHDHPIILFGQTHHLLTIADSMTTYIESTSPSQQIHEDPNGYSTEPAPKETIDVLNKLDSIFQLLISRDLLTRTEIIRLESIAERSRVEIVKVFEDVDEYHGEIGKIYEKTLSCIV